MYCLIPLAGPDCYDSKFGIRPLIDLEGDPLIKNILTSRFWYQSGEVSNPDLIFILRDNPRVHELKQYLQNTFPGCQWIIISNLTKGALLSASAGTSLVEDFHVPIAVDLVDLKYQADFSPTELFQKNLDLFGIIPYFHSSNEKYSYLQLDENRLKRAAEKQVISSFASAGTYFFRNVSILLKAISTSTERYPNDTYRDNLFVCPSFNGLIPEGQVIGVEVEMLSELSLQFH